MKSTETKVYCIVLRSWIEKTATIYFSRNILTMGDLYTL